MIEVIDTVEKFDALKPIWEKLEKNPRMRIQQTFVWNREVWPVVEVPGKQLWILKWTQDGREDVVICPFYIDGLGTLRYINDLHNDLCDCVYSANRANRYRAFKEVADTIMSEPRIKSVWLHKMYGESDAMHYLGVFLPGAMVARDNSYAWVENADAGEFLDTQKHLRSEDRKHFRKLVKKSDGLNFAIRSMANGDLFPRKDIVRLRDAMIAKGIRSKGFVPDDLIAFHEKLYNVGLCMAPVLIKDGQIVAMNIHVMKDDRNLAWLFLGLEQYYGTQIDTRFCAEWTKAHAGVIDFGVGTYDYKMRTFKPWVAVTCSLRMGKTPYRHFKQMLAMNIRFLKNYIKDVRALRKEKQGA